MKKAIVPCGIILVFLLSFMLGCVPTQTPSPEETARQFMTDQSEGLSERQDAVKTESMEVAGQLPVRYQKPAYMIGRPKVASGGQGQLGEFSLPVGADISTPAGAKPLGVIIGQIVAMKNMSVSYATDVDQNAPIRVDIRADQDFFKAVDNVLRPLDYYYELDENTIVIRHKETRKYHIAMPFINSTYATGVGGNVLGSTENNQMNGTLSINSAGNTFDIWNNIQTNLDKILEIWTDRASEAAGGSGGGDDDDDDGAEAARSSQEVTQQTQAMVDEAGRASTTTIIRRSAGKGYYTVDKPIGLISVTAPRSLLSKIEVYLDNLKSELYKQVSIEAKIVEVTLSEDNTTGIDWGSLLGPESGGFDLTLDMAKTGTIIKSSTNAPGRTPGSLLTLNVKSFNLVIDAMKSQGHVEVLSNPKISVMNGQPAMISVGENVTYVDSVESTNNEGVVSYTINTSSVMSGLGLGVIATIMENDEIILSITPVTTNLTQPIEYKTFGVNQVGLPIVNLREMNTLVRVRDGEMLVVGGLIDQKSTYGNDKVAGLGDVPFFGKAFRQDGTNSAKKELIILMRPKIISR